MRGAEEMRRAQMRINISSRVGCVGRFLLSYIDAAVVNKPNGAIEPNDINVRALELRGGSYRWEMEVVAHWEIFLARMTYQWYSNMNWGKRKMRILSRRCATTGSFAQWPIKITPGRLSVVGENCNATKHGKRNHKPLESPTKQMG